MRVAIANKTIVDHARTLDSWINGKRFLIKDLLAQGNTLDLKDSFYQHIAVADIAYRQLGEKTRLDPLQRMLESAEASKRYLLGKKDISLAKAPTYHSHKNDHSSLPSGCTIIDWSQEYPFPIEMMLTNYSHIIRCNKGDGKSISSNYLSTMEESMNFFSERYVPEGIVSIEDAVESAGPPASASSSANLSASRQACATHHPLSWDDFIGPEELVKPFKEYALIMKNLNYAKDVLPLDVLLPKGILLTGKPGVGKTTLARIFAAEANVHSEYLSVSDIGSSYVYGAALKLQEAFDEAAWHAKSDGASILMLDELDTIGAERGSTHDDEMRKATATMCVNMDGAKSCPGVIVIGMTNHEELVDRALLRPGRFSKIISVPDLSGKELRQIWTLYQGKYSAKFPGNTSFIPKIDGMTGAEVKENVLGAYRRALIRHLLGQKLEMTTTDWEH